MTPAILIAIMLLLGLVLCVLLANIVQQLRSQGGKPKVGKSKPMPVLPIRKSTTEFDEPAPDQGKRLARIVGRTRQFKVLSEGRGDPSAEQELVNSGVYASCERRLEQAFEIYSVGQVSLNTYETMVHAEFERAKRLRAEFRAKELAGNISAEALDAFREEIEMIEVAVQWCLDWAEDFRKSEAASTQQKIVDEN